MHELDDQRELASQHEAPPLSPSPPPPPPPPPPPAVEMERSPPRDLNPFGEPATPPAATTGPAGGGRESIDPPTPTTPPPPLPISNAAAAAIAAEGLEIHEDDAASPLRRSPFGSPLTPVPRRPLSPPPPVPPVNGEEIGVGVRAGVGVETGAGPAVLTISGSSSQDEEPSSSAVGRKKALEDTRLFEVKRSTYFGEKFDGDSLYWKCFVELIRRSQANNRRAINYATQKLFASHAYAKSLYGIRDHVDGLSQGTTESRCEKERKQRGPKTWPPQPRDGPHNGSSPDEAGVPKAASALDSLFEMEEHSAMRTLDMCDEAHVNVIAKQLKVMVKSLDDRFSEMVGQGTACLKIMHAAEENSKKAYSRYQEVVTKSIDSQTKGAPSSSGKRSSLTSRDAASSDVWLTDMNYRVAVTQQARVWKGVSTKLGDLFGNMKDIEVERRQAIQGGLTSLIQLQDGLLQDLTVLKDPVLQVLGRINLDRHLLDQEVRNDMRKGAVRLLQANRHDENGGGALLPPSSLPSSSAYQLSSRKIVDQPAGREPSGSTLAPDFLTSLESPLDSALIARSTMLERKDKMIIGSRWLLTLAILTHDSYLLLFDVPKGCSAYKKQLNARTSEVFAELVPKPEIDAMAVELGKHKDRKGLDSSGLPVPPSIPIDLRACAVQFKPDGKTDAVFEIVEIKPATGVKGVFKDYEETKFTLRGRSQEAMVDWICQITEMGRAGMKAVSNNSGKK